MTSWLDRTWQQDIDRDAAHDPAIPDPEPPGVDVLSEADFPSEAEAEAWFYRITGLRRPR